MAVNSTHPQYDRMLPKWQRCRDVAHGQDAVHAAGEKYLPKLKEQEPDEYKAYVNRATFFNATWRTMAGLLGMLFSKPPKIEVPGSTEPLLETVTDDGLPLRVFSMQAALECLTTNRAGVLVDYPVVNAVELTKADAQALNLRPNLSLYRAETIINWKEERINNNRVLTRVVLLEEHEEEVTEFEIKCQERWRVLDLKAVEGNGLVYRVRLFKEKEQAENGADKFEQVGDDIFPLMNNKHLDFIPFYFLGVDDTAACANDPALIDLVDLNLSHYRTMADYEHGCHFTGLPTGYICGHTLDEAKGEKIYLGSQSFLVFPQPDTKVGFLEFTGQGLDALRQNLDAKEKQMAILGARLLEAPKRAAEAAETAAIHKSGEDSIMASMAQSISMGLQRALQTFSDWAGGSGDVVFSLNRDFFPVPLTAQDLTSLVAAWQTGAISKETLFERLKRGQIITDSRTFEEEETKISNAMPLVAGTAGA